MSGEGSTGTHYGQRQHDGGEGAIGWFPEGRAGRLSHDDVGKAGFVPDFFKEFVHEARFACAGFPRQADELRNPRAGGIEAAQQASELRIAADHWRLEAEGGQATRIGRRLDAAGQPMYQHALGFAT